jgi:primosomal protein N' (replication factor Y) (superfamily II helicase)
LSTELSTTASQHPAPIEAAVVLQVAIDAPLPRPFDYLPPQGLAANDIPLGVRVRVPVGSRRQVGVVVGRAAQPAVPASALRRIDALLDEAPVLAAELLQLLRWTSDYYHHPLGEVVCAALPKALRSGRPASAAAAAPPARPSACAPASAAAPPLPPAPAPAPSAAPPVLSEAQRAAVQRILAAQGYQPFVLQGATGSGKTEVYLQCAAAVLERGRTVLVLVPEIALTPQLIERFRTRLPVGLAVLHSGLSDPERLRAWREARAQQAPIVLGTRSAVFAPLPGLGLIIVDEEHDSSYKQQEGGCRYCARDLAVVRAQQAQVPVVLGSATPALETLQNLSVGRYQGLLLPRRDDQAAAPLLRLVDLRAHAVHQGLSTPVIEALRRHLEAGSQVLVFINRRGYAPTLLCTACGWIAPCRDCDARLTVHRASGTLVCHHCGACEPLPRQCPRCGYGVKPVGQGTERVQQTLQTLFPDQPLLRLDRDSAARPEQLQDIVQRLRAGEARILVGTQMVTKGHHFPGMMLAVVLNADQGLFSNDFRAAERLAQTLVQVAGRAGRARVQGEVLIQTEYPEHPLLQSLLSSGYEGFAAAALAERQAAHWPPFARLALLRASTRAPEGALQFLTAARALAPSLPQVRLLGPVPATLARRAGRHHAQLLLESTARSALHRFIETWLPAVQELARTRRVRYALDVDPLDIG